MIFNKITIVMGKESKIVQQYLDLYIYSIREAQ
jgi:hypothetical protein